MTEQEAIKRLEFLNDALNPRRADSDESSCALQMGMKALEKQIPKKCNIRDRIVFREGEYEPIKIKSYRCPICNHETGTCGVVPNYCMSCGHKLESRLKMIFKKIRERLEDEKQRLRKLKNDTITLFDSEVIAIEEQSYNFCKEIVNQVEAEYNNGWIPCSERLPNEADYYLVTKEDDIAYSIDIALWDDYHWSNNGFHKADKVIAWQPLPEYYTPKGE